ncbi:Actin cytoskeleton-regulatory complex protein PAN1 [Fusarium oxysporum f. sp. albedinis]|nr:Actin cytoskeleton-regulatory complex protein PAN1 [Fusarium oxysporum f. sp. albedinis]
MPLTRLLIDRPEAKQLNPPPRGIEVSSFCCRRESGRSNKLDLANHYILINRAKADMHVVAGSKRLAAKEDIRPVFKLIASHCSLTG